MLVPNTNADVPETTVEVARAAFPKGTAVLWRSLFKGSWAEHPEAEKLIPPYNPEKAKKLIKEVEQEAGKPIPRLSILARKEFGGISGNAAQIAAVQLSQNGLDFVANIFEKEVAKDKVRRMTDFDLALVSLKGPGRDPHDTAKDFDSRVAVTYTDRTNVPGYKNSRANQLIDQAKVYDREMRIKCYRELQEIVMKDLVAFHR